MAQSHRNSGASSRRSETKFRKRSLWDDEISVLNYFRNHFNRCRNCFVSREHRSHIYLCPEGRDYEKDVRQYFYLRDDRIFSKIGPSSCRGEVEIAIPPEFRTTIAILQARTSARARCHPDPNSQKREVRISNARSRVPEPRPQNSSYDRTSFHGTHHTVYVTIPTITLPLRIRYSEPRR